MRSILCKGANITRHWRRTALAFSVERIADLEHAEAVIEWEVMDGRG